MIRLPLPGLVRAIPPLVSPLQAFLAPPRLEDLGLGIEVPRVSAPGHLAQRHLDFRSQEGVRALYLVVAGWNRELPLLARNRRSLQALEHRIYRHSRQPLCLFLILLLRLFAFRLLLAFRSFPLLDFLSCRERLLPLFVLELLLLLDLCLPSSFISSLVLFSLLLALLGFFLFEIALGSLDLLLFLFFLALEDGEC